MDLCLILSLSFSDQSSLGSNDILIQSKSTYGVSQKRIYMYSWMVGIHTVRHILPIKRSQMESNFENDAKSNPRPIQNPISNGRYFWDWVVYYISGSLVHGFVFSGMSVVSELHELGRESSHLFKNGQTTIHPTEVRKFFLTNMIEWEVVNDFRHAESKSGLYFRLPQLFQYALISLLSKPIALFKKALLSNTKEWYLLLANTAKIKHTHYYNIFSTAKFSPVVWDDIYVFEPLFSPQFCFSKNTLQLH